MRQFWPRQKDQPQRLQVRRANQHSCWFPHQKPSHCPHCLLLGRAHSTAMYPQVALCASEHAFCVEVITLQTAPSCGWRSAVCCQMLAWLAAHDNMTVQRRWAQAFHMYTCFLPISSCSTDKQGTGWGLLWRCPRQCRTSSVKFLIRLLHHLGVGWR